jgi:hypothetical protein
VLKLITNIGRLRVDLVQVRREPFAADVFTVLKVILDAIENAVAVTVL